jgi:hypothetical protein
MCVTILSLSAIVLFDFGTVPIVGIFVVHFIGIKTEILFRYTRKPSWVCVQTDIIKALNK